MRPVPDQPAPHRILLVEDEAPLARGLSYGLEAEDFQVHWAQTGAQALALARQHQPHLIILDLRLPDMSGYDVCRRLRADGYNLPILMLTARDEEVDKVLGLELGADDYVVKPYRLRELIARLRALLRRAYGDYAAPGATSLRLGPLVIQPEQGTVTNDGQAVSLTPTELRLLVHLARHPGQTLTREQLINAIWGPGAGLESERTVDVYIRRLREKLEADPAYPRLIVTVPGLGYRLSP